SPWSPPFAPPTPRIRPIVCTFSISIDRLMLLVPPSHGCYSACNFGPSAGGSASKIDPVKLACCAARFDSKRGVAHLLDDGRPQDDRRVTPAILPFAGSQ